jgi:PHP family Zn ribbon phosphoesterase
MPFPIKKCVACGEEFELKPDKPGFANRCPECSASEESGTSEGPKETATKEQNAARRKAIRDLLYRKDS